MVEALAGKSDISCGGLENPGNGFKQRALPCPVGPDNRDDLCFRDLN